MCSSAIMARMTRADSSGVGNVAIAVALSGAPLPILTRD
jgi:hypothetical protein